MINHSYVIPLPPIPWKRPGKNGIRSYDTQKDNKLFYGACIKSMWDVNCRNNNLKYVPINIPIFITRAYFFPIPKYKRRKIVDGDWYVGREDIDNLDKFLFDVLVDIGILKDDVYIVGGSHYKRYSLEPKIIFKITTAQIIKEYQV